MTWIHRAGRQWHYALPESARFLCGSFYISGNWVETASIPERGHAICRKCERRMMHAYAGAMGYKGQSERKVGR